MQAATVNYTKHKNDSFAFTLESMMVATDCPKIAICQRSTTVVQFTCNEQVAGSSVVGFL